MQTKAGGLKVSATLRAKFGDNYWKEIGKRGGSAKVPKGWGVNHALAVKAGRLGGKKSRRGHATSKDNNSI